MLCYTVDLLDSVGLPLLRRFSVSELAGTEVMHFCALVEESGAMVVEKLTWIQRTHVDLLLTYFQNIVCCVYNRTLRKPRFYFPQSFHSHPFNNKDHRWDSRAQAPQVLTASCQESKQSYWRVKEGWCQRSAAGSLGGHKLPPPVKCLEADELNTLSLGWLLLHGIKK